MSTSALVHALDRETEHVLEIAPKAPVQVFRLLLAKLDYNLGVLREAPDASDYTKQISRFLDRLMTAETYLYQAENVKEHTIPQGVKQEESNYLLDDLNSLPSGDGLRRRKPDMEGKLDTQTEIQQDLSLDVLEMVRNIKRNAEIFNEKLEKDSSMVEATSSALSKASSRMTSVGDSLQRYRRESSLGWWFYIWASVFLALSLIMGMVIIRIFPKW